jgi:Tfp pilus assembly protein PilF
MAGMQARLAGVAVAAQTRRPGGESDPTTSLRTRTIVLSLEDRFAESEACAREALELWPDDIDMLNALGVAVWRQGRPEEAVEICERALRIKPDDFRVLTNLGLVHLEQQRTVEAADCFRAALRAEPNAFDPRMNLGIALSNLGEFDEAMVWLESALRMRPDSFDALQNVGMNLGRLGRHYEAMNYFERAIQQRPDFAEIHRNLSYMLLQRGDYERGWPEHEWRLTCKPHHGCRINRTFWNGDDFRDQTILLHFEQGYGDTLQFIRFAPMVKRRGGRVLLLCQPPLLRLLARCAGVDLAFDGSGFEPTCQIQAPLMSLPSIFGTTLDTIPATVPYLNVEPVLVDHWGSILSRTLGSDEGTETGAPVGSRPARAGRPMLIGVAWRGNPGNQLDQWRSFPLTRLAPLAELPGVRLITLQVGHGADELANLGGRFPVIDLPGRRGRDFSETAAIMSHLDLVIAPCTAAAHLAGALGVPTWVPLCRIGDWRWLTDREDSPWYPTMRLFRQTKLGEWESVFRRMADALKIELDRRAAGQGSLVSDL